MKSLLEMGVHALACAGSTPLPLSVVLAAATASGLACDGVADGLLLLVVLSVAPCSVLADVAIIELLGVGPRETLPVLVLAAVVTIELGAVELGLIAVLGFGPVD